MPLHSGSNLQTGSTGCHQHISKRIAQTFPNVGVAKGDAIVTNFSRKGHYRTNTNGKISWVRGHTVSRNDWKLSTGIAIRFDPPASLVQPLRQYENYSENHPSCRIPDDCIDSKRYPLFMARDVMRVLIEQLQAEGATPS